MVDNNEMREEFEAVYPLPEGVRWAGVSYTGSKDAELLNIALEAWCLSRATLEAPKLISEIEELRIENGKLKEANAELSEVNVSRRNHIGNAKKAAGISWDHDLVGVIERLVRDAIRYNHIAECLQVCGGHYGVTWPRDYSSSSRAEVNAAIDAAVSKNPKA